MSMLCPVCGSELTTKRDMMDTVLLEEHTFCNVCSMYRNRYEYGYLEEAIDGKVVSTWDYTGGGKTVSQHVKNLAVRNARRKLRVVRRDKIGRGIVSPNTIYI